MSLFGSASYSFLTEEFTMAGGGEGLALPFWQQYIRKVASTCSAKLKPMALLVLSMVTSFTVAMVLLGEGEGEGKRPL